MEKIRWTDKYSVGVEILDDQHKKIISMINDMIDARDLDASSEIAAETLDQMRQYSAKHFKTEEKLMKEHEYPGYDA